MVLTIMDCYYNRTGVVGLLPLSPFVLMAEREKAQPAILMNNLCVLLHPAYLCSLSLIILDHLFYHQLVCRVQLMKPFNGATPGLVQQSVIVNFREPTLLLPVCVVEAMSLPHLFIGFCASNNITVKNTYPELTHQKIKG